MGLCLRTLDLGEKNGADLERRVDAFRSFVQAQCRPETVADRSPYDMTVRLLEKSDQKEEPPAGVDGATLQALKDEGLYVFRDFLQIGESIGCGQFGRVRKAILCFPLPTEVAVKTLSQKFKGDAEKVVSQFVDEGLTMKSMDHVHVLGLIGISFRRNGLPMVITPYMENGDLLAYIRNEDNQLTAQDLMAFGAQIAEGMSYLAARNIVHRDLAARNCLLDESLVVKIADFGLSRNLYSRPYYMSENQMALPFRWMAVESMHTFKFTVQSDVWSFGVLLWELMTRGAHPYLDVDSWDLLRYLLSGRRLPRPFGCPEQLFALMICCWNAEPQSRPSFQELANEICWMLLHGSVPDGPLVRPVTAFSNRLYHNDLPTTVKDGTEEEEEGANTCQRIIRAETRL